MEGKKMEPKDAALMKKLIDEFDNDTFLDETGDFRYTNPDVTSVIHHDDMNYLGNASKNQGQEQIDTINGISTQDIIELQNIKIVDEPKTPEEDIIQSSTCPRSDSVTSQPSNIVTFEQEGSENFNQQRNNYSEDRVTSCKDDGSNQQRNDSSQHSYQTYKGQDSTQQRNNGSRGNYRGYYNDETYNQQRFNHSQGNFRPVSDKVPNQQRYKNARETTHGDLGFTQQRYNKHYHSYNDEASNKQRNNRSQGYYQSYNNDWSNVPRNNQSQSNYQSNNGENLRQQRNNRSHGSYQSENVDHSNQKRNNRSQDGHKSYKNEGSSQQKDNYSQGSYQADSREHSNQQRNNHSHGNYQSENVDHSNQKRNNRSQDGYKSYKDKTSFQQIDNYSQGSYQADSREHSSQQRNNRSQYHHKTYKDKSQHSVNYSQPNCQPEASATYEHQDRQPALHLPPGTPNPKGSQDGYKSYKDEASSQQKDNYSQGSYQADSREHSSQQRNNRSQYHHKTYKDESQHSVNYSQPNCQPEASATYEHQDRQPALHLPPGTPNPQGSKNGYKSYKDEASSQQIDNHSQGSYQADNRKHSSQQRNNRSQYHHKTYKDESQHSVNYSQPNCQPEASATYKHQDRQPALHLPPGTPNPQGSKDGYKSYKDEASSQQRDNYSQGSYQADNREHSSQQRNNRSQYHYKTYYDESQHSVNYSEPNCQPEASATYEHQDRQPALHIPPGTLYPQGSSSYQGLHPSFQAPWWSPTVPPPLLPYTNIRPAVTTVADPGIRYNQPNNRPAMTAVADPRIRYEQPNNRRNVQNGQVHPQTFKGRIFHRNNQF